MEPSLQSKIEEMAALFSEARARLRAMAEERRHLEENRRRLLMQLDEPGAANPEFPRLLARIEADLDHRRAEEQKYYETAQAEINRRRQETLSIFRRRQERLEIELDAAQSEADQLRDETLPELRRQLDMLEERLRLAESRRVTLSNQLNVLLAEIPDLSQYDLTP